MPTVTPEKGYESFYREAEYVFNHTFNHLPSLEVAKKVLRQSMPIMLEQSLRFIEESDNKADKAEAITKFCVFMLTTHIMRTEKGDFFATIKENYPPKEELSEVDLLMNITSYAPSVVIFLGLQQMFCKKGHLMELLVACNKVLSNHHAKEDKEMEG